MNKQTILLFFLFALAASNAFSQAPEISARELSALCTRVDQIKEIPYGGESGRDAAYDAILAAGEAMVPCLIEKISDTKVMADPRCPRISEETKVGDTAYFLLVLITKIGFIEVFPEEVQKKYKTEGVYAYHEYIEGRGNRKKLQAKLRARFRQKQNPKS